MAFLLLIPLTMAFENETLQRDWVLNKKDFCIEMLDNLDKLSSHKHEAKNLSAEIISCLSLVAVLLLLFILKFLKEKIFSMLTAIKTRFSQVENF